MKKLLVFSFLLGCTSSGAPWQGYRGQALLEARSRDATYYLHFYQEGDPICEKQKDFLKTATADPKYKKAFAYRLKWNEEPKLQKVLGITTACILISFHGQEERGRSAKTGNPTELLQVLERAL